MDELLPYIGIKVALLQGLAGTAIPLIVVVVMTRFFGPNRSFREGLVIWRFALFSAFAMTIPYMLVAIFFGPEFPTIAGGLVGLAIVVTAARQGFLMPDAAKPWSFGPESQWDPSWTGTDHMKVNAAVVRDMTTRWAWTPYVLVGVLLFATRLPALPLGGWLKSASIDIPNIFGSEVSISEQPLYLPGTVFIVVSLITWYLHGIDARAYRSAWKSSFKTTLSASIALVFTVPMVQVFINSGGGGNGHDSMPLVLASGVADAVGHAWLFCATFIGGMGAFIAGSTTVSNMMFCLFQFDVSQRIGADPSLVVALQVVGAAAGNMICVHNVVAASAVAGLFGKEGVILRITMLPFLYYASLTGLAGLLLFVLVK